MQNNYSLGDLSISLTSDSKDTISGLEKTTKALKNVANQIAKISNIDLTNVQNNLNGIAKLDFSNLSNAFKPLEELNVKNISGSINSLKKLTTLNFNNVNFDKLKADFNVMLETIEPFIAKIQSAEPSLKAFSNALDLAKVNSDMSITEAKVKSINASAQRKEVLDNIKIEKANLGLEKMKANVDKVKKSANGINFSLKNLFNFGKFYALINYTKKLAQSISKMFTSAIDFEETLNKFQVSMGEYYNRGLKFVNDLTYAFNLSTESIMNYQSTFKNMLDALGNLGEDASYGLSETLTRMAIDYASLFNVQIETAMQQFQGVLSGQIRQIRTVAGYDVSEASIYALYKELGGTKTMRQLDQLEKRLLRIIALQRQMGDTGALGDFAKTINSSANQLKQLGDTIQEIGRWIGQLMMVWLEPMIEKVLAWSIVVRELLKSLAIARGYVYEDKGGQSLFGDLTYEATEAEEAIKSVKTTLLGFDKLNVLGSTDGSTFGADYSMLTDEIGKYKTSLDETANSANKLADSIMTSLGYTKEENYWAKDTEKSFSGLSSVLLGIGSTIALVFGGKGILSGATKIFTTIGDKLGGIKTYFATFIGQLKTSGNLLKFGIIGAIITLFVTLYSYSERFRESVNNLIGSLFDIFVPIIKSILEIAQSFMPLINTILDSLVNVLVPIFDAITPILVMVKAFFDSLMPLVVGIVDVVMVLINSILNSTLNASLTGVIALLGAIVNILSDVLLVAIEIVIVAIEGIKGTFESIVVVVGAIAKTIFLLFSGNFEEIEKLWSGLGEKMKEIWKGIGKNISNTFITMINGIITGFASFVNSLVNVINNLTSSLSDLWEWAGIPAIPMIPNWNPKLIPQLASGGVVTKPTTVMVGEYSGAKTNPEIVTPENLMREVFVESMLPIAQAIMSGDQQVVGAIEQLANRPINLNGRRVSENIFDDMQQVAIRKGKMMFAR